MSTYILMKILESTPDRYDRGIRILTLGGLDGPYNRLISRVKDGQRVLDLGCGTGALTLRAAQKGARVKGIDINPRMLEIAQRRVDDGGFTPNVELREMGVAELGCEKNRSYDVVMSGLCFSELSDDELNYALEEAKRLLKPGGLLLLADETRPKSLLKKMLNWCIRSFLKVITAILTQETTNAVDNLPGRVEKAGLKIIDVRLNAMESFVEVVAINDGHDRGTL